ncbi:hypothetical protein LPB140_03720 [Sphingorhabdus lutea]|uniref:Uncharacterized protein n=2 Tax=Sphingorhabdus lutea TaxID=1913578 RepID=A0A1L3JAC0_9SPHN|nr:hypothetical protein LPB140_03720 [Sphingorhabdus lutea]
MVDYNYRMTVVVQTPQGEVKGSAVWRLEGWKIERSLTGYSSSDRLTGEAVMVDLPNGKTIFLLLGGELCGFKQYSLNLPEGERFICKGEFDEYVKQIEDIFARNEVIETWSGGTNKLVYFDDLKNPASVKEVDKENMSASFGEGYRLKAIYAQPTKDPVTTGIEKKLVWLGKFPEPSLDPNFKSSMDPTLSQTLTHGDFKYSRN